MEDIKWMADAEILKQIGAKVRQWRLERNVSQKQLAVETGLSTMTVQQIEAGKNTTVLNLLRVLRVLDRLELFALFFEKRQISPIEYERLTSRNERQRASKHIMTEDDTNTDNTPLW